MGREITIYVPWIMSNMLKRSFNSIIKKLSFVFGIRACITRRNIFRYVMEWKLFIDMNNGFIREVTKTVVPQVTNVYGRVA